MTANLRAVIAGTGSAVPKREMPNSEFEKFLDTTDEWIVQRTGIRSRRLVSEGESTATLATEAARNAIEAAGIAPTDLDLIICATISPEMPFPATACFVQDALGATDVPAFDISAACSGFVYALATGSQFIQTGAYKNVLVIGVDVLSRMCDFTDRGSCILFGDGAGAVVLQPTTEDRGLQHFVLNADGGGWDFIHIPAGGTREPASAETVRDRKHFVKMRGRDVYKFAVDKMQWLLAECMSACNLTVDDVDMVIPHQVNTRIIDSATSKNGFPSEKVFLNIQKYGNTSGASIPLALDEAMRSGAVKPGQTIIFVAFGAGLTWAGAVVKL